MLDPIEIDALPAGRALDELIAEQVFNHRRGVEFGSVAEHDWVKGYNDEPDSRAWEDGDEAHGYRCVRCGLTPTAFDVHAEVWSDPPPPGPCDVAPPTYSIDIAAAFDVATRMNDRHNRTPFDHPHYLDGIRGLRLRDIGRRWVAHFIDDYDFDWEGGWVDYLEEYPKVASAATVPLAICRAALKVLTDA